MKAKKSKPYVGLIPFDIFGNQLHYPEGGTTELKQENFRGGGGEAYVKQYNYGAEDTWRRIFFQDKVQMLAEPRVTRWDYAKTGIKDVIAIIEPVELDNYIFTDTLTYDHYARGRSAAYFKFKRTDGREVVVFLTDFEEFVKLMVNGKISGNFTFCKRGQNFGCKLV